MINIIIIFICVCHIWSNPVISVSPPWSYIPSTNEEEGFYDYKLQIQHDLIKILAENNFKAIPSYFVSGMQFVYDPRSIEELQNLIKLEISESTSVELIPVIDSTRLVVKRNKYSLTYAISIYLKNSRGSIDEKLLSRIFYIKDKVTNAIEFKEKAFVTIYENLKTQIDWKLLLKKIPDCKIEIPNTNGLTFATAQTVHCFGQSYFNYYDRYPKNASNLSFRIEKNNYKLLKINENNDKIVLQFDAADELPSVLYAYLTQPDGTVIRIDPVNFHIQQPPDALPQNTFTSLRYLVINLPQARDGTVISYCVKFINRAIQDTSFFNQAISQNRQLPFSKDYFLIPSSDRSPWQIRLLTRPGSLNYKGMIYSDTHNISCFASEEIDLAISGKKPKPLFKLFKFIGANKASEIVSFEPYSYEEPRVVRISSVAEWQSAYGSVVDSINNIVNSYSGKLLGFKNDKTMKDTLHSIYEFVNFINDSLRYLHVSFAGHKIIPVRPDSLLVSRTGDCKDFSILCVSELRKNGLDAYPVLVNIGWDNPLVMDLPSLGAFNHMIVYCKKYRLFIDPTYDALPGGVLPSHLLNVSGIILNSELIEPIWTGTNSEDAHLTSIVYNMTLVSGRVECLYGETSSVEKSAYLRNTLPYLDSTNIGDYLFPKGEFLQKVSTDNQTPTILFTDDRATISREFFADNALNKIAGQIFLTIPEIPLQGYIELFTAADRKYPLRITRPLNIELKLVFKNAKVEISDKFTDYVSRNLIVKSTPQEIRIKIKLNKLLIAPAEYLEIKKSFEAYREIMTAPMFIKIISAEKSK